MAAILDLFKLDSILYHGLNKTLICYLMFISETCGCGLNYVAIGGGPFCICTGLCTQLCRNINDK